MLSTSSLPPCRYKKDIADQAELAEMHASVSGSGPSEVSRSKFASVATRVKNVTMSTPSIPPITPEEQARILDVPYDSIAIRANSLHRLMQSLGGLERLVTERWDAGRSASSRAASGDNAFDWVAGMFNGTKAAATNAADGLLHFIAIKAS